MTSFKVAHVKEQGVDLIIVIVAGAFQYQSTSEQAASQEALQLCAAAANLKGTVVPVWQSGNSAGFFAPPNWHPFFRGLVWDDILLSINGELQCG